MHLSLFMVECLTKILFCREMLHFVSIKNCILWSQQYMIYAIIYRRRTYDWLTFLVMTEFVNNILTSLSPVLGTRYHLFYVLPIINVFILLTCAIDIRHSV